MRIHYLQHVLFENPGTILVWAEKNGHIITNTQLYNRECFPAQRDFDWLVIMGGPMNIYEEDKYPWLVDEKVFIREAVAAGKIVIGLCLGGQLIADVIGGQVTRNPCKEIGWFPVQWSGKARSSPLFSFFPKQSVVFQWHGDTFSILPAEALCIARNDACSHQAFMYKNRVFGFQFHLENTPEIIRALVENCADDMVPGAYVQTPQELLGHPEYVENDNIWMDMFLTQLAMMDKEGVPDGAGIL